MIISPSELDWDMAKLTRLGENTWIKSEEGYQDQHIRYRHGLWYVCNEKGKWCIKDNFQACLNHKRVKVVAQPETFKALADVVSSNGDGNACTVIAASLATGVNYHELAPVFEAHGRLKGRGFSMDTTCKIISSYGYQVEEVKTSYFRVNHVPNCNNLYVTPNDILKDKPQGNWLLVSQNHVAYYSEGVIHDWSAGRRLRFKWFYKVEKIVN